MEATDADVTRVPVQQEPRISAVELRHVDYFWPLVRHWIVAALAESVQHELTEEDVYRGCLKGEYLMLCLALGNDLCGVAVLGKSTDPKGQPYLMVICCGGVHMPKWIGLLVNTCRVLALDAGASEIVLMGRPGWRPTLQALGLRLRAVVMVLQI